VSGRAKSRACVTRSNTQVLQRVSFFAYPLSFLPETSGAFAFKFLRAYSINIGSAGKKSLSGKMSDIVEKETLHGLTGSVSSLQQFK
jgi:hypothetical protein